MSHTWSGRNRQHGNVNRTKKHHLSLHHHHQKKKKSLLSLAPRGGKGQCSKTENFLTIILLLHLNITEKKNWLFQHFLSTGFGPCTHLQMITHSQERNVLIRKSPSRPIGWAFDSLIKSQVLLSGKREIRKGATDHLPQGLK